MTTAEIVVIGGGIFGCAIAWRLAAIERREVLLLERNELGTGASARAAGLIVPLRAGASERWIVAQTLAAFRTLPAASFRQVGALHVAASAESEKMLHALSAEAADICTWMSRDEVKPLVPWLDATATTKLLFVPQGGYVDPYLATMAYAQAARSAGATLRPRTPIREIIRDNNGVTGVRLDSEIIRSRHVVVAAGAWSAPLVEPLEIALPMAPVRSSYWISARDSLFAPTQPVMMMSDAHSYARPESDRLLLGAREIKSPSWDARTLPVDMGSIAFAQEEEKWSGLVERGPALRRLIPCLDRLGMAHYIAGLSTYTADGRFLLGPVERMPGLVIATGCNGSGIAAAGGFARVVADLVAGRRPEIDLAPYRPDRFDSFDAYAPAFRERCAGARSTKATGTSA